VLAVIPQSAAPWIGATDAVSEVTWRWSDGTPWDYGERSTRVSGARGYAFARRGNCAGGKPVTWPKDYRLVSAASPRFLRCRVERPGVAPVAACPILLPRSMPDVAIVHA